MSDRRDGSGPARELLLVAGEASGDLHGARLLAALTELVPGLTAFGLGSDGMAAAGLERLADSAEISAVGLAQVARVVPRARQIFNQLLAEVERRGTRLAVLIDFPEFNLRLAPELKRRGVAVVYYVSPQLWAWRQGRVKIIAEAVDRMLVLFPFEVEFYRRHGIEAVHVGHPLVDELTRRPHVWEQGAPQDAPFRVALLPGSRRSEIEALLPVMLQAAQRLTDRLPVEIALVRAPTIPRELLEEHTANAGFPLAVIGGDREERLAAIAGSHVALCASGTATLETGLLGTPMVVIYRLGAWSYLLGRLLVRSRYIAMVNLVLGREAVPELIQADAEPGRIAREVEALVTDPARIDAMRRDLAELALCLGEPGASARAAAEVAAFLPAEVPA